MILLNYYKVIRKLYLSITSIYRATKTVAGHSRHMLLSYILNCLSDNILNYLSDNILNCLSDNILDYLPDNI